MPTAINPDTNTFDFSESFWQGHKDVMPQGGGIAFQTDQHDTLLSDRLTLLFDARMEWAGQYTWQLTTLKSSGRLIKQLQIEPGRAVGHLYDLDQQGRKTADSALTLEDINGSLQRIIAVTKSEAFRGYVEATRRRKSGLEADFANYLATASLVRQNRIMDPTTGLTERQAKERKVRSFGFVALRPYAPPAPLSGILPASEQV